MEVAKKVLHEVKLERSIGTLWAYNYTTKGFEPRYILNTVNEQRLMTEVKEWKDDATLPEKINELLIKYPLYENNPAYDDAIQHNY